MPLDPKDGIGSYIKDFKKSKAPQFKGKSEKKRRDMAVAAYLDAKRGPQEAKFAGSTLKLFGQLNRDGSKPTLATLQKRTVQKKNIKKAQSAYDKHNKNDTLAKHGFKRPMMDNVKEGSYKVSIAGLPDMYMDDKTPAALLQKLRKIVKQPSMIQDVERTTDAKKKKAFRQKAQGREVTEYKYDYGTPESVKLMKKNTPGQQSEARGADSKGHFRPTEKGAGMTAKGVAAHRRKNPGSKLQTAVTGKVKPGSKDAKRRKSFCARMSGMKGPMKDEKGRPTRKAMSLRRWKC